jgi:hypothetical protein
LTTAAKTAEYHVAESCRVACRLIAERQPGNILSNRVSDVK